LEKKKIAFIEMETHSALLEQWYLLVSKMDRIDFHFFVSPKVNEKLTAIPQEFISVILSVTATDFAHFDGIVVNTLHRDFNDYQKWFGQKPVLCLIHNLNFSLFFKTISLANVLKEKERFTYFLKLYLKEKVASRRKVILKAKQYGVISNAALQTIQTNGKHSAKSKLIQMNYCNESVFPEDEVIHIVMPGNVSNKRKDVDLVLNVISRLNPKTVLQFTFLGKPENDSIVNQLEHLKKNCHRNIRITYFNQFIPWVSYSKIISKAHLLLCPIKNQTSFYWVDEFYGSTKVSGSEADCMYNGKIGIFPGSYPKMDWHNLYYDNEKELIAVLENLTVQNLKKEYESLKPYTEKYTFGKVKNTLEEQLLQLTKN
jgi:glycosyltransferase involved in cell wall biosynthesis